MAIQPVNPKLTVIMVGAGHSHVHVIKMLPKQNLPVQLIVINMTVQTPYSGMLPGYIQGLYSFDESHIDVAALCNLAPNQARFIKDIVTRIDGKNKTVHFKSGRRPLTGDIITIDTGCTPKLPPEIAKQVEKEENILPVKPISNFSHRWENLQEKLNSLTSPRIVIVGGGAAGVDLSLSLHQMNSAFDITIVSKTPNLVPHLSKPAQKSLVQVLKDAGITFIPNFDGNDVQDKNYVVSKTGKKVFFDVLFLSTDARAAEFLGKSDLKTTADNFVKVKATLESVNTPDVFAVGDCCHFGETGLPKAGVFAVREGPILLENLTLRIKSLLAKDSSKNYELIDYVPQTNFLGILGTGRDFCVGVKGDMVLRTPWMFDLKDWIDRTWMAGYQVNKPRIKKERKMEMKCDGCGAKVGSDVLQKVLQRLRSDGVLNSTPLFVPGQADDCAEIKLESKDNDSIIQSVDLLRSFITDSFIFGKIVAHHSLSDIFAMGGKSNVKPISALAMCLMPVASENITEQELYQVLSGCCEVLNEAGCPVVGGHTAEADSSMTSYKITMGLSITASVKDSRKLLRKKVEGNINLDIVLTKPIGSGTILAARMENSAKSSWFEDAVENMLTSNAAAADVFQENDAMACTDITGFGLLGHLNEMIDHSQNSRVTLFLESIPFLSGAVEAASLGYESSLFGQNFKFSASLYSDSEDVGNKNKFKEKLLYDPQTSGGLLAFLPKEKTEKVLQELADAGYTRAALIGEIGGGSMDTKTGIVIL
eukprot:augustus_masked-scaffold_40-processed-gene-1.0-mRNA-1 protein AED:1.00 eAED:1.00 QI:0/-1/0/0/-1/1/1/0/762